MNAISSISPHDYHDPAQGQAAYEEAGNRDNRFWLWLVLGLCGLAIVAVIGGYAFGHGIVSGSHLREQFATGQDEASQPMQLGIHEQGSSLLHRQPGQARYYSGPSELAMAASRGEVVIDENGVMHEVELERLTAAEDAMAADTWAMDLVPETLPPLEPLPKIRGRGDYATSAVPGELERDAVALNTQDVSSPAAMPRRSEPPGEDIFFGQ